tara:strand:+ start:2172 stop:2918 length:747 start_codon:yes stop_codon:yes gene_type:complete
MARAVKVSKKKWTDSEVTILEQYSNTSKSAYQLYHSLLLKGYSRTFKAVKRKIEQMGMHKPSRYATGHEKRLGYLDIESTGLKANIDIMLSWAIKTRDTNEVVGDVIKKSEVFNGSYDKRIMKSLIKALDKYDLIFTYYGTGFDIPFMRTRALDHDLDFPVFRKVSHKDIYYLVRSKLQLTRSSLKVATQFLGIDGKTNLDPRIWRDARYGNKDALKYVYDHNIADVEILEDLHKKIEKYTNANVVPT